MEVDQRADLNESHFQKNAALNAVLHSNDGFVEQLHRGEQGHRTPAFASVSELVEAVGVRRSHQIGRTSDRHGHHVSQITEQLLRELAWIHPGADGLVQFHQRGARVAVDHARCERSQSSFIGRTKHRMNVFDGDARTTEAEELLEQGLAIAHRSCGTAGDQSQRCLVRLRSLGVANESQSAEDLIGMNRREIETLATR